MTAYTDLQTAATTLDTTLGTLVTNAKSFLDKAAIYETSVRHVGVGAPFEGNQAAADAAKVVRAALAKAIETDGSANGKRLARALRIVLRGVGVTAASFFP